MSNKYKKELNIFYKKIELPTGVLDFDINSISKISLQNGGKAEKTVHLLKFNESYLSNKGSLRVIHPSREIMQEIRSIRKKKNAFTIAVFSLETLIHKTKFASFKHKSVIFDFKKLWGLVDFVIVHTEDKAWVNHKFTSLIPSITYHKQNIIHLAHHSDFLYIYHTPDLFSDIDQENARELVAKIPEPFWVREDKAENKIVESTIEVAIDRVSKLKNFEINTTETFFSEAIQAAPALENRKKSILFNSLATENNETNKNEIINYLISDAWYENEQLLDKLITFLDTLVVRHLYLMAVYSVYEIEKGIKSLKPEYTKLLKAGLLNKDIERQLVTNPKLKGAIWLAETFHGLDIEEAEALCDLLDKGNINPRINVSNIKEHYEAYSKEFKENSKEKMSFEQYKDAMGKHSGNLSKILEDPKLRVLSYINAFLCSTKHYLVPYGYLGSNPLAYYNCMLEVNKHRSSKESYFADIRNKLFIVCYLPGFLSSVLGDNQFIDWYSNQVKTDTLLKNPYLKSLNRSHEKYIKSFMNLDIVELLKQVSSEIKPSYIPVVFRYGAFASTTALIRSNANVSNRMEFELYDSPEKLHNQYSEKEESVMPKSVDKPKDHSIDNGMSLFSLNLTNNNENGLRHFMLKVAQLHNLDFKVGISGNLDQAMTQALLLGMATTVKKGDVVLDEDQMFYMTYLYCIFMAHSVDHTVDEILMSSNTFLLNSTDKKYPILNIADYFARPVFGLYKNDKFKSLVKKYNDSFKPNAKILSDTYIKRVKKLSELYEDIYNFNCLYSSLSEGSLYGLLSTHSERHSTLLEQYSRKKKAEINGGFVDSVTGEKVVNYNQYAEMNQYMNFVAKNKMKATGVKITSSNNKQIERDFNLHSTNKESIDYLKYNFKDNKFDAVYKSKEKKVEDGIVYAKKQNTRYCYGYFNSFFVKNRITTFYKIKDQSGNYLIDLHDEKYSFATPNSDSKIYRLSPELLSNKDDFNKVAKDIIKSYKYISFDQQRKDLVKEFGKDLNSINYEVWVGLSHQAISCFSVLDDLSNQELSNAFIDALYYIKLMQLYYGKTIGFLMIDSTTVRHASKDTHYYVPTVLEFKKYLTTALKKASKPVIDRFLIILNIYNNTVNDNMIYSVVCRLPIILFSYAGQKSKLKALQSCIHKHKNKDYKSEINFSAWFESIFHIQSTSLSSDYIGNINLIMELVKQIKSGASEYKQNLIQQQIENRQNQLNFYQILMKLIQISTYHKILSKSRITNTSSSLYDLLEKPEYKKINKLVNNLFIHKSIEGDRYKVFHTKLVIIENTYKELNQMYKSDFFETFTNI